MNLLDKTTKAGNEIEIDIYFQTRCLAIPLHISWWNSSRKAKDDGWISVKSFDIHFLCFSFHFTCWKWSDKNGKKR